MLKTVTFIYAQYCGLYPCDTSPNPFLAPQVPKATSLGTLQSISDVYNPEGDVGGANTITKIFSAVLGILTIVAGLMFVIQFTLGALSWITSSGDREKVQKAQNKMTHAVIGLIAVVAAYSIAFIVGAIMGLNILNPAEYILNFWST